jgi:hypothetical protein
MTISLNDTVNAVRRNFRDVKWSDETLAGWVKEAVRDYDLIFPTAKTLTEDTEDEVYRYDFFAGAHDEEQLPSVFGVISFEYPSGEDPPKFINRHHHTDRNFFAGGGPYYDIVFYPDGVNGEIWLSSPESGKTFEVKYFSGHGWTSIENGDDESCEVNATHRNIIVQYVVWQCWRETLTLERETDLEDRRTFLEKRVVHERDYYTLLLGIAKGAFNQESQVISWEMDKYDRIY